jgi:hypothetical protein
MMPMYQVCARNGSGDATVVDPTTGRVFITSRTDGVLHYLDP